jgi:hypothetical protein
LSLEAVPFIGKEDAQTCLHWLGSLEVVRVHDDPDLNGGVTVTLTHGHRLGVEMCWEWYGLPKVTPCSWCDLSGIPQASPCPMRTGRGPHRLAGLDLGHRLPWRSCFSHSPNFKCKLLANRMYLAQCLCGKGDFIHQ